MLVLGLDTSAAVGVALVEVPGAGAVQVLARREVLGSRGHGENLAPSIEACLAEAGRRPAQLGAVVVGTGPGPFTGLRVGLVTAAALGDALGIPSYGVCSLDGIGAYSRAEGDLVVVADARRKEVYWARYDRYGNRSAGPDVCRPQDVPLDGAQAVAGAGARMYPELLRGPAIVDRDRPDPVLLVEQATARVRAGAPGETLVPLYLRRPDAVPPGAPKAVRQ